MGVTHATTVHPHFNEGPKWELTEPEENDVLMYCVGPLLCERQRKTMLFASRGMPGQNTAAVQEQCHERAKHPQAWASDDGGKPTLPAMFAGRKCDERRSEEITLKICWLVEKITMTSIC